MIEVMDIRQICHIMIEIAMKITSVRLMHQRSMIIKKRKMMVSALFCCNLEVPFSSFSIQYVYFLIDLSDVEHETNTPLLQSSGNSIVVDLDTRQAALNYSTLSAAAAVNNSSQNNSDPNLSSTETLLRNIQGLLKVAADNARQQERQISYEKGE